MDALYSSCPACHHRFVPWAVWKITRWSCMNCSACHCKLNRRFAVREIAVSMAFLLAFGALYTMVEFSATVALMLVAVASSFYLVDVCTVRLFQPRSFRVVAGYKA